MKLEFDKALKRIIAEDLRGNNPVPDILGFLHLKRLFGPDDFSSKLEDLLMNYKKKTYMPKSLLKIDVPKANFTVRPMARPTTEDWLIYEAIIDYLSKKILRKNKRICQRSFSILNFKTHKRKRTGAWLEFDERSRDFYKRKYRFAVTTDITGYYENINLEESRKRIIDYLERDKEGTELTNDLFTLLRKWSDERISGYGLPQGPPASSFLADIFLDYVDRRMEKYKGYIRYMDDIRIFCKKKIEAKIALKDLTIALRNLKLNINAKKTDILSDKEIEEKLFDPDKSFLNMIETTIKSGNRELIQGSVIPALLKLVEKAFSNDAFEKTHLNFALYRLGILHNSSLNFDKTEVIENIRKSFVIKPHHSGLFCDFLSLFPNDEEIPNHLISFLKSKDNIYEWQELKVLQSLLRFNFKAKPEEIDFLLDSARNSNKHSATRAFYFLLAGKHGSNRDRNLIIDSYNSLSDLYTKMAIILSVQELGTPTRNDFYTRTKRSENNKEINQFVEYVKSLSNPIYFLTTQRPKIETYEQFEKPFYESM
jgi:hypothetical protein